ncbi:phospho-sugar mutase [Actinoplanes sp. CA-142083]|uniref:phospho-sugar mutase n=1 Tax=Actinoplanes sp. CA-142083 TaxID=3239903 RepID=UPI003D8E9388
MEEAEAWLADDPDPASRAELRELIDGLPGTADELRDRFAGPLTFGTAGLRGRLRAGPNGMNLAVVTRAAAGLVAWLAAEGGEGPLVIGYDARYGSRDFAERTARVATGAGREALVMPSTLPTPVLAYAVRALDAVAGVMVTASHNPPQDNGYKVYLGRQLGGPAGDGAQIVPPADSGIEAAIRAVGPVAGVRLGVPGTLLDEKIVQRYVQSAANVLTPGGPRDLTVVYTPLHGVGGGTLAAAFVTAGFGMPPSVTEQAEPDPEFPTVSFPNPEEPGAMDKLLELARMCNADLAIANDPDADRCALAIPGPDGWRPLRGDELGVLLADHLIRRGVPGTYATTIVSSQLLGRLCAARGVPYAETLTGFKWIVRAAEDLAFGYEEALGYCVAPALVRDKDGITAALTAAEVAAGLQKDGKGVQDRLDELAAEFGVHATDQLSVRVDDLAEIGVAMGRARRQPPATLLGAPVTAVDDLLPENDVLTFRTAAVRVVIRPSGTEPKLKAYLEVVEEVTQGDVTTARARAADALQILRQEVAAALGV